MIRSDEMKNNYIADVYEMLVIDKEGNPIIRDTLQAASTELEQEINGGLLFPNIPRSYTVKNSKGNEKFYELLKKCLGKIVTLKSDSINGKFEVSEENENLVITEVK
jgi:hypothetical protein